MSNPLKLQAVCTFGYNIPKWVYDLAHKERIGTIRHGDGEAIYLTFLEVDRIVAVLDAKLEVTWLLDRQSISVSGYISVNSNGDFGRVTFTFVPAK